MNHFKLKSPFKPCGDQIQAISEIVNNYQDGKNPQTLLGVTGSGKTFTMANVIERIGKKTLILAHNKTLAAQLYSEFREFFPDNAVEFFVSYYDYYQPEAYVPGTDTYIEKDSAINDEIDKLRHRATRSLLERDDVIVIASVSCIYGIGSPVEYESQKRVIFVGDNLDRDVFIRSLISIQYERNEFDFIRGAFRVRGDVVEVFPAHEDSQIIRVEFFGDEVEKISIVDPLKGEVLQNVDHIVIYPKSHYVVGEEKLKLAIQTIKNELRERLVEFENSGKLVEKQRLEQRTLLDLEMLEEMGYCSGIENYSRHLTQTAEGEPPPTLIDYFKKDFLMIIDESHISIPQVGGMFRGDRARKENLVNYGFRLPSALDNRPLNFDEFEKRQDHVLYVSATPADYELKKSGGEYVEQIIRPTGLLDPIIEVRDAASQVENLFHEIKNVISKNERVLVTTLTKKLAEELTNYYFNHGIKVKYLHSDIDTIERIEIIKALRQGEFDVLVGINLLREGLDIPEVSLVAILDADKEGFLRSERSLIQTIGRAARNESGRVIMYAYKSTKSMDKAIEETKRRREIQTKYNQDNNIVPKTIKKSISGGVLAALKGKDLGKNKRKSKVSLSEMTPDLIDQRVISLSEQMKRLSKDLRFEEAAAIRDEIKLLKEARLMFF